MQIIRVHDKPLVPWKNGAGLTREIAAYFDKTHSHDFLWRISQAIIDQPCYFSRFDGVDRSLVVMEGEGITIKSNANLSAIDVRDKPVSFSGEEDITATPIGKTATTDLNIMTRRGFFSHKMAEISFYDHNIIEAIAETTFIICNHVMMINGQEANRFDAATGFAKGDKIEMNAKGKAQIFVIGLIAC